MNPSTLSIFKATPGVMSVAEGAALHRLVRGAPRGIFVELGTHSGKSAVAIASALHRHDEFHMVDPDFKVPAEVILSRVLEAGCKDCLTFMHGDISEVALHRIQGDFSFVFIDSGEHTYELCRAECDIIIPRLRTGGIIAFHDFRSQFIGVEQCYNEVLASGLFEEIVIDWPDFIAEINKHNLEAGNDSYHHPELPNPTFLGALRKI